MTNLSRLGMEVEKMSGYYYVENKLGKVVAGNRRRK